MSDLIDTTRVERMARKLQTKVGASIYATRKDILEPVLGRSSMGERPFVAPIPRVVSARIGPSDINDDESLET